LHRPAEDAIWEQRRYWQHSKLVRIEWWQDGRYMADGPVSSLHEILKRDFCYRHGTQIYPTLGCQVCRERPKNPRT
jgi:hypothetical protein